MTSKLAAESLPYIDSQYKLSNYIVMDNQGHEIDEQKKGEKTPLFKVSKEGDWQEQYDLVNSIVELMNQLGYEGERLLFCGYGISAAIEISSLQMTFAVTLKEWREAIKYYADFDSPSFYAAARCRDDEAITPVIGVYDAEQLKYSRQTPSTYVSKVVGEPIQHAEIARFDISDWRDDWS